MKLAKGGMFMFAVRKHFWRLILAIDLLLVLMAVGVTSVMANFAASKQYTPKPSMRYFNM